ncbi:hypothetical protein [Micromonospora aurantiaca (nom. illeg.)]|uniref:hypothetical protein n=1 Tax=Micromonospora aurantiaca (nom. illeg.) TaxID=47850 RepID=UPI003EBA3DD2
MPVDQSALDQLSRAFQDESAASMLLERLDAQNVTVDPQPMKVLPLGYTGARLVVVTLRKRGASPKPRRCVLKLCPPGPFGRDKENTKHQAALDDAGSTFSADHLVKTAFDPVFCDRGWVITGQEYAHGRPLASLRFEEQIEACRTVRAVLLDQWTGSNHYDMRSLTLAELVREELRGGLASGEWLQGWARELTLLSHPNMLVLGEDGLLPNPFQLFGPGSPYTGPVMSHLVGRTHGDLHADNILIPVQDGTPVPAEFRLIDLAAYHARAPLSRDVAALLMALLVRRAGDCDLRIQDALLDYLLNDHRDNVLAQRVPPEVAELVDVLRTPTEEFVREWQDDWHAQLKVSVLAQAMLHAAYSSGTGGAQAWALRLAGRLTRRLLGSDTPSPDAPAVSVRLDRPRVEIASMIVDRDGHRADLRAALLDDLTSVVAIQGPAGVGKTVFVLDVLTGLGWLRVDSSRRVCWHEPALPTDVSIQTLIADLERGVAAGVRHLYGSRSHARLEIALEAPRDDVPIIVIDAAELLLDDDGRFRDAELDLAIESIASRRRSLVKVVLVTTVPLAAHAGVTWPDTARRLDLGGLEPRFLVEYLRTLDVHGRDSSLPPEDDVLLRMQDRLAGNPRLAELFHALISRDTAPLDYLAEWLTSLPANEVRQRVVHRLAGLLPVDECLVLEALAAFGIPVEAAALTAVVRPELPPDRCAEAAATLVASRIVRQRRDGRLQVPAVDLNSILNRIDDGGRYAEPGEHPTALDLLHRAANEIYHHQKDYADVHTVGDLDMHLAELDCLLRARMFGPAHELIEQIDEEILQVWGSSALLRWQREAVRDHLGDDDEAAMRNYAALGTIYSSLGETLAADRAFDEALVIARRGNDRGAIRGIYLNMGARYWEHDEVTAAREYFTRALGLAQDDDDDADRALALEGLANCDQQGGAYTEAFAKAEEALAIAQDSDSEHVVNLALKLARWRAECGDFTSAKQRLASADFATDGSRRAEYLNGRADLLLHQARYPNAVREALRAVDEAEEACDPEALLQALTTLALAHLHQDEVDEAARQITRAMRYRPRDDHLDTLALRAVVASRLGQHATAAGFFDRLAHEAKQRIDSYDADSWAWDFLGLTSCFAVARGRPDEAEPAQAAFRRAVIDPAMPTYGRNRRIAFLVGQLATAADWPADLLPVLDDLAVTRPCPRGWPSGPRR